jgi:group I intron endonuclease
MQIGIYKIQNPIGKIYIGQSIDIQKRLTTYQKRIEGCKSQIKLYNSLVKYGFSEHIFEIIEKCEVAQLNRQERYWQDYYSAVGSTGLNCRLTTSEDKSGQLTKEVRDKIAASSMGKVKTQEHRDKIAASKKGIPTNVGENNPAKRQDVKLKMRKAKVGKPSNNIKPVYQLGASGEILREFASIKEAAIAMKTTGIGNAIKGRSKTAGGFGWKYKNN